MLGITNHIVGGAATKGSICGAVSSLPQHRQPSFAKNDDCDALRSNRLSSMKLLGARRVRFTENIAT